MNPNQLTKEIMGAAIEVHRTIGPGLLESVYEECLGKEMSLRHIPFQRQVPMPLIYKGEWLDTGFRLDLLIDNQVVIEVKAVDQLLPIHDAQLLTYLRMGGWNVGLLINFNTPLLKDGIRRLVHELKEE